MEIGLQREGSRFLVEDAGIVEGDDQTGRWAQSENLLKWLNKVSEEALRDTVRAVNTSGSTLQLELKNSGLVDYDKVRALG